MSASSESSDRKAFPVIQAFGLGEHLLAVHHHATYPLVGCQSVYVVVAAPKNAQGVRLSVEFVAAVETRWGRCALDCLKPPAPTSAARSTAPTKEHPISELSMRFISDEKDQTSPIQVSFFRPDQGKARHHIRLCRRWTTRHWLKFAGILRYSRSGRPAPILSVLSGFTISLKRGDGCYATVCSLTEIRPACGSNSLMHRNNPSACLQT